MNTYDDFTFGWFIGLFEGEGTFAISVSEGKAKYLAISMTDLDTLEKVKSSFGGSISFLAKRKEHWKDAWIWRLVGVEAYDLCLLMEPHLMSRRKARCRDFIDLHEASKRRAADRKKKTRDFHQKVKELRDSGLTHAAIAEIYGVDRSYISHTLKKISTH